MALGRIGGGKELWHAAAITRWQRAERVPSPSSPLYVEREQVCLPPLASFCLSRRRSLRVMPSLT